MAKTKEPPQLPPTPELTKLRAVADKSQAIHDFLEWLSLGEYNKDIGPVHLMFHPFITERAVFKKGRHFDEIDHYEPIPRDEWQRSGEAMVVHDRLEKLLAAFFEIDLNKVENEKRALLAYQRALNGDPADVDA